LDLLLILRDSAIIPGTDQILFFVDLIKPATETVTPVGLTGTETPLDDMSENSNVPIELGISDTVVENGMANSVGAERNAFPCETEKEVTDTYVLALCETEKVISSLDHALSCIQEKTEFTISHLGHEISHVPEETELSTSLLEHDISGTQEEKERVVLASVNDNDHTQGEKDSSLVHDLTSMNEKAIRLIGEESNLNNRPSVAGSLAENLQDPGFVSDRRMSYCNFFRQE
jgi:hypothetical protein